MRGGAQRREGAHNMKGGRVVSNECVRIQRGGCVADAHRTAAVPPPKKHARPRTRPPSLPAPDGDATSCSSTVSGTSISTSVILRSGGVPGRLAKRSLILQAIFGAIWCDLGPLRRTGTLFSPAPVDVFRRSGGGSINRRPGERSLFCWPAIVRSVPRARRRPQRKTPRRARTIAPAVVVVAIALDDISQFYLIACVRHTRRWHHIRVSVCWCKE